MRIAAVNSTLRADPARQRWHGVALAPRPLRGWMTDRGSLTQRLQRVSARFQVIRLAQRRGRPCSDEAECLTAAQRVAMAGMNDPRTTPRPLGFLVREVLLECDGQPTIFAHSVIA
ncbi:MAG: chorismate lyase, partial [Proteobacteria bacterium]|nr:chorismate lyase [Burkholderiales bacterium]